LHVPQKTAELPPGPASPLPVQMMRWTFRPTPFMEECRRRYGDVFTLRFVAPEGPMVFVSDPALIEEVYKASPELLHAGDARLILEPLVGRHSVLLLDEQPHMRHRKVMLPAFHGERMKAYRELMVEVTERELASLPRGEEVAVWPVMQAITLDVIMRAVFGVAEGERYDRLRDGLREMLDSMMNPARMFMVLGLRFALKADYRPTAFDRNLARVDELLFQEIRERRGRDDLAERDDVLSMLLQARDDEGRELSDQELRDELVTLLVAGHETTATSLAWTFERLARHPDVLERALAEADAGEDEYLDAVVKETLRLRPVLPITTRRLTADMDLDGHRIPAGRIVAPCVYLVQRRPDIYPEPARFRPERFLERPAGTYSWIPFGGGVRRCLGASFAMFESLVVLSTVLSRASPRALAPGGETIRRRAITFAPNRGARLVLDERTRAGTRAMQPVR
jgi:cytochrome P450 family 135